MFPNKIIVNKREYYDDSNIDYRAHTLSDVSFDRENDTYLKGMEYLSSIIILTKCNSFIGGLTAGTYAVNYLNNKGFDHTYFFYTGTYK